jgi:hypothetical protein
MDSPYPRLAVDNDALIQQARDVAQRLAQIERMSDETTTGGPPPPTNSSYLAERLARVEAAIEGLRHSQNLTIAATVGVGAILAGFIIVFGIYGLQRIDAVDSKIDQKFDTLSAWMADESARTRQDLVGIATAIANSITAARQMQPPPAPLSQQPPKE